MKYYSHLAILFSLYLGLGNITLNAADTPAQSKPEGQPELKVIKLAVYPAPIPRPALKYRLLPRAIDQTPGNAALIYWDLFEQLQFLGSKNNNSSKDAKEAKQLDEYYLNSVKLDEWLEMPLAELPKEDIRKFVDQWESSVNLIDYIEIATHRKECNWELPFREAKNPYNVFCKQSMYGRHLGRMLAVQARLSLAEGKPEEAIKSLQMGFTLSKQFGKEPMPNYLVGLRLANMMTDQLLDLSQVKNAPNLYWTLSNLPHPFISIDKAMEAEEFTIERQFPELQEARKGQHSPEQWQKLWESLVERINDIPAEWFNIQKKEKCDAKKLLEENYPKARDYLINLGWPKTEIQSMAPAQVLLLHSAEIWEEMRDDSTKWLGINYSQWLNNRPDLAIEIEKTYKQQEIIPLSMFIQPCGAQALAQARIERGFDSLRLIEAIRLYAYSHDGKLPGGLDDIKEVPIPANPMTGKPFPYHLEGDTAVLLADGDMRINYEYRIKIAK